MLCSSRAWSAPAVLIDDSGKVQPGSMMSDSEPVYQTRESFSEQRWNSVFDFRRERKVGVGTSFLGRAGFVGLDAELNLLPEHSLLASIGGGPGYMGTSVGWKWTPLHGTWHPTISMAVSSWTADDKSLNRQESIPQFFSANSRSSSDERLRQIFLVPAVGIQTIKLGGESAGAQFFVEALLFTDISTFALKPLGSVGAKYFF